MEKKKHAVKKPSLFRQLIAIHYEQAMRHRALRLLSKQVWSVELLEYLVEKAARDNGRQIHITVEDKDNRKLTISSTGIVNPLDYDDSIFNHLDDERAVNDFIAKNSRR